ncbi:MAG: gamma-glutamyltransferase [Planctomycetes bacterium]|nr:gamma-glutamyltransferase [Planctomycetota bacterium]
MSAVALRLLGARLPLTLAAAFWLGFAPLTWARPDEQVQRRAARGAQAMVVSEHPLATHAGLELLRSGGNAVDAACATALALAVVYPVAGNLGGGGFLLHRGADGATAALDFRETAPQRATRDMFLGADGQVDRVRATRGHLAAGIPGSVAGLCEAHARLGKRPWKEIVAPALRLARDGFAVDALLAEDCVEHARSFALYPASAALFLPEGQPLAPGALLRQPELARSLQAIAERGRDGFYRGEVAAAIVREMERGGGLLTAADLEGYRALWREPLMRRYRGHEIWSMPPPSSGGPLLLQMLGVLEKFDLREAGAGSARHLHLLAEAMSRAYADRAEHLGDPDFYPVPTAWLFSDARVNEIALQIDPTRATAVAGAGTPPRKESPQTTHLSVLAPDGSAVSLTTTINTGYGSKVVVAGAGFLLNNEMDDFSAAPGQPNAYGLLGAEANAIVPLKRMLSSMTPTIVVRDGAVRLVVGTPGGGRIITSVLQVVVNVIDFELELSSAVDAPRVHHQWRPNRLELERHGFGFAPEVRRSLEQKGHRLHEQEDFCSVQAILRHADGRLEGFGDQRRMGFASGY